MITINNLCKRYNQQTAVDISYLNIEEGEMVGLVGNNGAGKTTLFRLMLDLVRPDRGQVLFKEKNVAATEEWKTYTSAYLDEAFLISHLTSKEYFYFLGRLHNLSISDVDEVLQSFDFFLGGSISKSGKYIRDLSKGNQFKVGIIGCLLQNPEILILDEPFANLDPSSQMQLIQMLKHLHVHKRTTIFISSHDLNHITNVCDRILLMEKGKIIRDIQSVSDTLRELEKYFKV